MSPRIKELSECIKRGDGTALHTFIEQVEKEGAPIVEMDTEHSEYYFVTFIWIGNEYTDNVYVFGSFPGWDISSCALERLLDTNLWFKTYRTNGKFVTTYQFSINDNYGQNWVERSKNYKQDPFNKKTFLHVGDSENPEHQDIIASVFELKMEISNDNFKHKKGVPQGKVDVHRFYSSILKNEGRIWIYTPHEYTIEQAPYDILVAFDGRPTMTTLSAPTIIDNLIHEKSMSPCIMIGIDSVDRVNELTYNNDFNSFLITELIPWVRDSYHVTKDSARTTICGFSLGGLAAFFAATQHPDIFGNILSLSGSVHWKKADYENQTPWIEYYFRTKCKQTLNIYMSAGKLENKPLLLANQNLYKTLECSDYRVHYNEFQGGHDDIWWREQLQTGMIY